ncbi:MAG: thiamine pyrophosphate-dependent dehydrogenase E1 component subunit alpha [Chloroflexi bacterium]|nr:thiamine pyrophosphate-dependent dehydrogenase E1 component subunit alpha [Chloroflexota bacterium]
MSIEETISRRTGSGKNDLSVPPLTEDDLLEMYRTMVLSRTLDERVWLLNRQGKAAIVASAQGHEGAQVGAVKASDPSRDHYLIYYRELCTMMALGVTPTEMLLGFLAKEGEPMSSARQFPLHGSMDRVDIVSFSNVVATQLPHAVGFALADQMRGIDAVTIAYFGDGAASMGDTHESMNFAGIHKLPVVFFCENNRYAISVPLSKQMAIDSVADRAEGYGMPGVTVDGMDPVAVYEAMYLAIANARNGGGPTLVEARVERFYPHTSDDDHTRYRSADDIETMTQRDPIEIMEQLLVSRDLLGEARKEQIWDSATRIVNEATQAAEDAPLPQPTGDNDIYKHLYADSNGN